MHATSTHPPHPLSAASVRSPPPLPTGSAKDYLRSLRHTPRLVARRALFIRTAESAEAGGAQQLAKTLGW